MWKSRMAGGGGNKKRFQYCTGPSGQEVLYLRALQGDSGRNPIDPSLQDNVLIPNNFFEYIYFVGCAVSLHSITNSRLIAGGQNSSSERQTVFFTAVNPMDKDHKDPYELDLTKPRLTSYKQKKWKRHQDTVYWVDFQLAQRKGLKFYQTRCNAITFYDTLPAYCISIVVVTNLEKSFTRKYMYHLDHHRRFLSKIIGWKNWIQKSLDAARTPNESNQNQKTNYQERWDPWVEWNPSKVACRCLVKIEEEDQTRTKRPVGGQKFTKVEELDIDFRVPGSSHAVMKEAEHFWVQELEKRSKFIVIEKHFKPTCSRITSTTHSATIRRRWSANWAM